jgi:hypothetical protein
MFDVQDVYDDHRLNLTISGSEEEGKRNNRVGGFVQNEVWRKAIREAVAGLWDQPLSDSNDENQEENKMKLENDVDVIMT